MLAKLLLKNRFKYKKIRKDDRGISPVISTIIISGTLLVILVIASFVSTNILELQIANTEFEQAKANMFLLDEVVQDVAKRPGSGGYVQFNQRSGGIGLTQHTEKIGIVGPGQPTVVINSPSTTSGLWTNATGAYADGSGFASTSTKNAIQSYGGYGFAIPANSTIAKIRVRLDVWTVEDEKITLYVSENGGSSWLSTTWTSGTLPKLETAIWVDVTGWTTWALEKINNDKIWVRVEHIVSGSTSETKLDWVPVEVTYGPLLTPVYESPPLMSLVYRAGSSVSGSDTKLRGDNISPVINMTIPLGYLRIETGNGVQIKLDYHRFRIVETGSMVVGGTLYNFIEITFLRLSQGSMGGSGTVNVKIQNTNIKTVTRTYDTGNVPLQIQLDSSPPLNYTFFSDALKTTVIFTEITVQVSIS